MKKLPQFRKHIDSAMEQSMKVLQALRSAQQTACDAGPLAHLSERRTFELLQKAISFRDDLAQFQLDIQD